MTSKFFRLGSAGSNIFRLRLNLNSARLRLKRFSANFCGFGSGAQVYQETEWVYSCKDTGLVHHVSRLFTFLFAVLVKQRHGQEMPLAFLETEQPK